MSGPIKALICVALEPKEQLATFAPSMSTYLPIGAKPAPCAAPSAARAILMIFSYRHHCFRPRPSNPSGAQPKTALQVRRALAGDELERHDLSARGVVARRDARHVRAVYPVAKFSSCAMNAVLSRIDFIQATSSALAVPFRIRVWTAKNLYTSGDHEPTSFLL